MASLQESQLDTEMENCKIKIFPTDSIIWLNIWEYFKGLFPGDSLQKEKKNFFNLNEETSGLLRNYF